MSAGDIEVLRSGTGIGGGGAMESCGTDGAGAVGSLGLDVS